MTIRHVILSWNDEDERTALEEKLKEYPEYNSPEAVQLSRRCYQRWIGKIREYCDKKGIECYKDIKSGGIVFVRVTEEQVKEISVEGVVNINYGDEPIIKPATQTA